MAYEPIFSPDTTTYLQMQIYRFPGYSIFLRIFSKFFGENYAVFICTLETDQDYLALIHIVKLNSFLKS